MSSTANFQLKWQKHMANDSEEPAVMLTVNVSSQVESFYAIVDSLVSQLNRRIHGYSEINYHLFFKQVTLMVLLLSFLRSLIECYSDDLHEEIFEEWV